MPSITTTNLPPNVSCRFDKDLLYKDLHDLRLVEKDIARAHKRYKEGSRKRQEHDLLLRVYKELHEWIKAEKAYQKATNKQGEERPIVPIKAIYDLYGQVGNVVRGAFYSADLISSNNNGLQEV